MHGPSYALLGIAALSHGYLHSMHQAAQQPSWRSLISRGPHVQPRQEHLIQCGAQMTGALAPADDVKFATLNTNDLAVAQNRLMAFCERGGELAPSGSSTGRVETSGSASIQLCNLGSEPLACSKQDMMELFEAIQCGTKDAPQMAIATPSPDHDLYVQGATRFEHAEWFLVMGPTGAVKECAPLTSLREL